MKQVTEEDYQVNMSSLFDFLTSVFASKEEVQLFIARCIKFKVFPDNVFALVKSNYDKSSEFPAVDFSEDMQEINLLSFIVPAMFPSEFYEAYLTLKTKLIMYAVNTRNIINCLESIGNDLQTEIMEIDGAEADKYVNTEGPAEFRKQVSKSHCINERIMKTNEINFVKTLTSSMRTIQWFIENLIQNVETFMNSIHSNKFDFNMGTKYPGDLKNFVASFARMMRFVESNLDNVEDEVVDEDNEDDEVIAKGLARGNAPVIKV